MAQKKDKILPIKVWLDEESCYNNEPQYSEGYVEYVREDYHAQALLYVLHKGVEQGKKEMLDKMCEWLNKNLLTSDITVEHHIVFENFIKCFKEAMEDKEL